MDTATTPTTREALDDLPPLITVTRAAKFLGLSRATAYRYAAAGDLPTRRMGRRTYVVTACLRPLIEQPEEVAA